MNTWKPKRRGFTLFQLLVLLALFAFLLGILLPAVAKVREAAMRLQTANNLKQIALAAHTYHDANKRLPPVVGQVPGQETAWSVFFYLLPYVEEGRLYQDGLGSIFKNDTAAKVVKVFLNPADVSGPPDHVYRGTFATTSFAVNWMVNGTGNRRLQSISDGTSNTIAYAERYQMCDGQPNAWAYPSLYYWTPTFMYYSEGLYQIAPDANSKDCDVRLAQTPFRAGMQASFCDGSVRTLGPNARAATYRAACTPTGGEVIDFAEFDR
jgi:type II secretory pathway pseudopilin PulG